ncbi:hypothetical protein [Actinophytocola sp.]|uniref:hypothetical protein n=1 Tax=Actinophytocola sp. TaxID=1872138 RepID=UPI003D6C4270
MAGDDADGAGRARRGVVAPPVGAGLLAATVVGLAVWARGWLGVRTWWVVGLVLLAALVVGGVGVARWRGRFAGWPANPDAPRPDGATVVRAAWGVALVCVVAAAVVAGTGLWRLPLSGFTHHWGHDASEAAVDDRLLGDDLPPVAAYATGLVLVVAALWCAVASARGVFGGRRGGGRDGGRVVWAEAVVVTAVLVAGTVVAAVGARTIADRSAPGVQDTAQVGRVHRVEEATREGPAIEPAAETSAPGAPGRLEQRWSRTLSDTGSGDDRRSVVAVPGWDAIVVFTTPADFVDTVQLRAGGEVSVFTARDGSLAWSYTQRRGGIGGVAVDPVAGRVLVMVGEAAVVLRLDDGQQVATHRAPSPGDSWGWLLVPPVTVDYGSVYPPPLVIGRTAVLQPHLAGQPDERPGLAVLEVATGEVVASAAPPPDRCQYAAATNGATPTVLRWGEEGGDCEQPALLQPDGEGGLVRVIGIETPRGARPGCCTGDAPELLADGGTTVVSLTWGTSGDEHIYDVVIVRDGELTGRLSTPMNSAGQPVGAARDDPVPTKVLAISDAGVVAEWFGRSHLLSVDDGTELASRPASQAAAGRRPPVWVESGDRPRGFSVAGSGRLVVFDVATLTERFGYDLDPQDRLDLPEHPGLLVVPGVEVATPQDPPVRNVLVVHDETTLRAFY